MAKDPWRLQPSLKSDENEPPLEKANGRLHLLRIVTLLAFLILAGQVWRLQIVYGEHYAQWADRMRFREVNIPAPRGVIYDRNGQLLVRNIPSFTVYLVPADLPSDREEERQMLRRLVSLLELTDDSWVAAPPPAYNSSAGEYGTEEAQALSSSLRQRQNRQEPVEILLEQINDLRELAPYRPIKVKSNVSREQAFIIEENHLNFPGVRLEVEPLRQYTTGELTSHVLGYVGPIPAERFDAYSEFGYDRSDRVGLMGLEFSYEDDLKGVKGVKNIEVDVAGREVRVIGEFSLPEPGHNLILTLDVELQQIVENALRRGLERSGTEMGVAIAMDPRDGSILAIVSYPSYDNNLFMTGISWEDYEWLSTHPRRPLVNHAIGGQFPPGSTFKIVPASAGLQEGVVDARTRIRCEGTMYLPNQYFPDDPSLAQPFVCWIRKLGVGHGPLNVVEALAHSCDIYFYQLGGGFRDFSGLGLDRLTAYAKEFGFGSPTGIDLPGESSGLVPTAQWKRLNYSETWVTGDTYNMSIGQGFVLATPLQVINSISAIANGGTLYQPHLVKEITDSDGNLVRRVGPDIIRELPLSDQTISYVQQGLESVVTSGTAPRAALAGVTVAGKTSTAEFAGPRDERGNLPMHASFVAYAPVEEPEIAVLAFVYSGGEGTTTAVPIVTEILSAYFGVPPVHSLDVGER